jgi:hypothetical protein
MQPILLVWVALPYFWTTAFSMLVAILIVVFLANFYHCLSVQLWLKFMYENVIKGTVSRDGG